MVTYTSSALYRAPLKPRINIYRLSDTSYSSPIYTYNAFTDSGTTTKPISLNFDSETTNVGTFSIEIEDTDYELEPDTFMKGNRVFIECSKDGSTWQPAFKGLVRSSDQQIYGASGRNFTINGYSYLIRLNERVINTIKESLLIGTDYDRTDSAMFTNNLINDLLTTDSNYVYSQDDTQLYTIFKNNNISSSPITEWIPRLDAQFVTVNDALNSVLEFSNGLVMLNPADDQLVLYNPDLITSATGVFLLTNQMNQSADDADYTMYPLEPYKYNISYDYPDSGSRLIGSIGQGGAGEPCFPEPLITAPEPMASPFSSQIVLNQLPISDDIATTFEATIPQIRNLRIGMGAQGNHSAGTSSTVSIYSMTATYGVGAQVGSSFTVYRDGVPGTPYPNSPSAAVPFMLAPDTVEVGPTLVPGTRYWIGIHDTYVAQLVSPFKTLAWVNDRPGTVQNGGGVSARKDPSPSTNWTVDKSEAIAGVGAALRLMYERTNECGGGGSAQATIDADPVFAVAHDRNMSNRLGIVERVISGIPTHIKTAQTLNEYLYNKLYYASKPRFTFDFPSVSMPNRIPKAGDICAHTDTKANVGTSSAPIQTGVISSVQYSFEQGSDDALGLRRLSLSTTGIKRGSY